MIMMLIMMVDLAKFCLPLPSVDTAYAPAERIRMCGNRRPAPGDVTEQPSQTSQTSQTARETCEAARTWA
jgi:hypothetical protein